MGIVNLFKRLWKNKKPAAPPRVMSVGAEQLQNLLEQRIPFLFLDLRSSSGAPVFDLAELVVESEVVSRVQSKTTDFQHPIILICENGKRSAKAARKLETVGYFNLFVLDGGTRTFRQS